MSESADTYLAECARIGGDARTALETLTAFERSGVLYFLIGVASARVKLDAPMCARDVLDAIAECATEASRAAVTPV